MYKYAFYTADATSASLLADFSTLQSLDTPLAQGLEGNGFDVYCVVWVADSLGKFFF